MLTGALAILGFFAVCAVIGLVIGLMSSPRSPYRELKVAAHAFPARAKRTKDHRGTPRADYTGMNDRNVPRRRHLWDIPRGEATVCRKCKGLKFVVEMEDCHGR